MLYKKTLLLAGTKEKSLGRYIGESFQKDGWEIWLYSRHTGKIDKKNWHQRRCDITSEKSVNQLLSEIPQIDVSIQLADTGGLGILFDLKEAKIRNCIEAKLTGSILLSKYLIQKAKRQKSTIKLIWCAGNTGRKLENAILYSLVNSGLAGWVNELNHHFRKFIKAYYLPTTLILPSTLGEKHLKITGQSIKKYAKHPNSLVTEIKKIINKKIPVGVINKDRVL